MKKILQTISCTIASLILLGVVFGVGYFVGSRPDEEPEVVIEEQAPVIDLQLPAEVEKRIITEEEVISKLVECSNLTTYCGEYSVSKTGEYTRYMLDDIAIPGTTNSISIDCSGIVKVGCDIKTIIPTIDNDSCKIYIALPELTVQDNYIIWDSVVCREANSILNPISFSQYQAFIGEMKDMGLADVESKGIYEAAEENFKCIIVGFLSGFENYEVVFL